MDLSDPSFSNVNRPAAVDGPMRPMPNSLEMIIFPPAIPHVHACGHLDTYIFTHTRVGLHTHTIIILEHVHIFTHICTCTHPTHPPTHPKSAHAHILNK